MSKSTSCRESLLALCLWSVLAFNPQPASAQQSPEQFWTDCESASGQPKDVIAACTAYLKSGDRANRASAYAIRGNARSMQDKDDAALADLNRALKINPEFPTALIYRARVFAKRSDFGHAIGDLDLAVALSPEDGSILYERGLVHFDAGDNPAAIADLAKSIEIDKQTSEGPNAQEYAALAKAYAAKGDNTSADSSLAEAHRLDPAQFPSDPGDATPPPVAVTEPQALSQPAPDAASNPPTADGNQQVPVRDTFDVCAIDSVPAEEKIRACTSLIEDPGSIFVSEGYAARAILYRKLGRLDEALADLDRAVELRANDTSSFIIRGEIYSGRGDHDRAISDFTQALALYADAPDVLAMRAREYSAKGDIEDAKNDLSKVIELSKLKGDTDAERQALQDRAKILDQMGDGAGASADRAEDNRLDPFQVVQAGSPSAVDPAEAWRALLVSLGVLAGVVLAFVLLWLVARRQKPQTGPHRIELPNSTLDPLEAQYGRILPIGITATGSAQALVGLGVLGLIIAAAGAALWLFKSAGVASTGGEAPAVINLTTIVIVAAVMFMVFIGMPAFNLLLATVPRGVSRVGGLPILALAVLGLVLTPLGFVLGWAKVAEGHIDDPPFMVFYGVLAVAALAIGVIYSYGLIRGLLSILLARDKAVELMRATPSSRSLWARVMAQALGLPPVFEYAMRPRLRFLVIMLASIGSGFCFATGTVFVLTGTQTMAATMENTAGWCADAGGCSGQALIFAVLSPVFMVVLPVLMFALGGLLQAGVQRLVRFSLQNLQRTDPRAPILFLRAFGDDQVELSREAFSLFGRVLQLGRAQRNLDHLLLEEVTPYGPHVALGNPADPFPPYGAARGYFQHKDWKQAVADLVARSRAIVLCVDPSEGVWWEVDHIAKRDAYLDKTLFLLHPKYRKDPDNGALLGRLAGHLGLTVDLAEARSQNPPPGNRPNRPVPTVLGFFVTEQQRIQLVYSSTFSRLAFLLTVRLFIRSRIGLAPVALPRAGV